MTLARRLLVAGGGASFPATSFEIAAAPRGGGIWFTSPQAVTYAGHVYIGYLRGDNGTAAVQVYDEAASTTSAEVVLHAALNVDDHAGPSLLVRDSDHKLLAFYSVHDGPTMFMRVSANSLDTDPNLSGGFASEVDLDASWGGTDYTYAVPIQLTGETNDPIYVFYRDITSSPTQQLVYNKSTDGGATWGARQLVFAQSGRSSYWKIAQNGDDRIDFALTDGHPAVDALSATYHFYYEGGAYFKSDGTSAGSPTLDTSDVTLVAAGTPTLTWVLDAAVDATGKPYLIYVDYPSGISNLRYYWARWTGAAWDVNLMAESGASISTTPGSNYYPGGVAFDQSDPTIVYVSMSAGTQMWKYVTEDNGATWSASAVSPGGTTKQIRPVTPKNADEVRATWMTGTYSTYTSYSVGISGTRR